MRIGVPRERMPRERRVALVPEVAVRYVKLGYEVILETGAGLEAGFTDEQYRERGCKVTEETKAVYAADIVLKVQRPTQEELAWFASGSTLICFVFGLSYPQDVRCYAEAGLNLLAMDAVPRITKAQRMDALSSQSNVAGYKAVLVCANALGKMFPLLMTAAGTISPAKVVIMGAGVAGLQALGTARRLGAVVEVSDVRPAVKEEVQSLGGRFIDIPTSESMQDSSGYAKEASADFLNRQRQILYKHVTAADAVITTALVPGKRAPILVTAEMVQGMRPGSVILDMAVEFGGNCELSKRDQTVVHNGVTIIGESNLPSMVAYHASELYARNLLALVEYATKDGKLALDTKDEIIGACLLTRDGQVVNERIKQLLAGGE
ncbi:MAG: Re/Si-specific NAD(P)(+) transhydrogenase subunit alpha [Blastocatellia bacterium]|nr:Re/Si-specific NAD(P)(+) transhydrogenase subunit alpha [Blastocatellia bacterium]